MEVKTKTKCYGMIYGLNDICSSKIQKKQKKCGQGTNWSRKLSDGEHHPENLRKIREVLCKNNYPEDYPADYYETVIKKHIYVMYYNNNHTLKNRNIL